MRIRLNWDGQQSAWLKHRIDEYFKRTADWSRASNDMNLEHVRGKPYERLVVRGDFFWESGWRISHFALTCPGDLILVAEDDAGHVRFHVLE
ncbi:MAG: hypothetical protein K6T30_00105 [Alicyclobacillus sp.]|nr:hypothetical protein [Alicyclobacillus sp.]